MNRRKWSVIAWIWCFSPIIADLIYVLSTMLGTWWAGMEPSGQAAWVQAISSIIAIIVAVAIPYFQRWSDKESKKSNDRKVVMSAAANLSVALDYASINLNYAPAGDGVIGHDFNLAQAREFMKIKIETREAIQQAIDKAHYFDEKLCEQIVLLSIAAPAYDRVVDSVASFTPENNVDQFFKKVRHTRDQLSGQIDIVRSLLKAYLPTSGT